MSLATRILADYKRTMGMVGENIAVRRFSGSGPSRTHADTSVRGRVTGYEPKELVGSIQQGDRKVICLVDTLGSVLPVTTGDALMIRGKQLAIITVDDNTRRVSGTLIALEIQARG